MESGRPAASTWRTPDRNAISLTVGFRNKLILIFILFGLAPMLALTAVNYITGVRTVEATLRNDLAHDATIISHGIELELQRKEHLVEMMAHSEAVGSFGASTQPSAANAKSSPAEVSRASAARELPEDLKKALDAFFSHDSEEIQSVTIMDAGGNSLVTVMPVHTEGEELLHDSSFSVQLYPKKFNLPEKVWSQTGDSNPVRLEMQRGAQGTVLREAIPIVAGQNKRGALVAEIALDPVIREVADMQLTPPRNSGVVSHNVVILDSSQTILHHTTDALSYQNASVVMPKSFAPVAQSMASGQAGEMTYEGQGSRNWMIAFRPVAGLGVSVGAQADADAALSRLRRQGVLSLIIALVIGLLTAILVAMVLRRVTRSIERVAQGAAAVAAGDLDQHIEITASGETKLLAESFNQMTERLRDQIAREAESRQFESFLRLSAMLTHDLKNAIAGLSLLVRNMEKQFHREEFRRDAMRSLVESTSKLRSIVSKLSEPVESLSGEHQRPRPIDLVGLLKSIVQAHAVTNSEEFKIEMSLPDTLTAFVEKDRIERVIENLVINAIEAMTPKGGTLKIAGGEQADGSVYFTVADTGPGMTEEFQRERLFQAFATTKPNGVGLGLYTCREIVRAHGGYIDVDSKRNVGTEFKVVLPSKEFAVHH